MKNKVPRPSNADAADRPEGLGAQLWRRPPVAPRAALNGYEAAALCAEGVGEAALGEYEPSIHLIS